jgi:dTDP-4-amino-4,6-dideoxygalactose transaminase
MKPAAGRRRVPIIDLAAEYRALKREIRPAIEAVLRSGIFVLGPHGEAFEKELAGYCGTRHSVGLNSGTDAITLASRAQRRRRR